jgi:hypothetical protein
VIAFAEADVSGDEIVTPEELAGWARQEAAEEAEDVPAAFRNVLGTTPRQQFS